MVIPDMAFLYGSAPLWDSSNGMYDVLEILTASPNVIEFSTVMSVEHNVCHLKCKIELCARIADE